MIDSMTTLDAEFVNFVKILWKIYIIIPASRYFLFMNMSLRERPRPSDQCDGIRGDPRYK